MEKMLTKRQKRITRQVRISEDIHREIRRLAIDKELTVSKLIDGILLENSELNNLLTYRRDVIKERDKRTKKILCKESQRTTEDFNKITF